MRGERGERERPILPAQGSGAGAPQLGQPRSGQRVAGEEDHLAQLLDQNRQLRARIDELADSNALLASENARLRTRIAEVRAAQHDLQQQVEELRRQLGLNSSNSGKPPSSDGPAKPPARRRTRSRRRRSGKRPGGQPGHKGATLRQTDTPDRVEVHLPSHCADCGAPLSDSDKEGEPIRRQVFDLPPPPPPEVTEHQAHACRCAACGGLTRAEFPEGVAGPVQYGPRVAAIAVYLTNAHFLPEQRLAEVLGDLFQVRICTATLARMTRQAAQRWAGFTHWLRQLLVSRGGVKHLDETGFRIAGRTQWLHVLSTPWLTHYRTHGKRGSVLQGLQGILVHDHWAPYFTLPGVLHAMCNAHHLRELEALLKIDGEDWAGRMQRLLRLAHRVVRRARERGIPLPRWLRKRLEAVYDELVQEALDYHEALPPLRPPKPGRRGRKKRRPGHNLALRLCQRRESVLRFLTDAQVPFTNNQAEQDLRMMKLRMKISGSFRSEQGARDFATLRSVLSTAKKQGQNRIQVLLHGPEALQASLQY